MNDEFIIHLLSKIKDTPENRKILTQFASRLDGAQSDIQTEKTLKVEDRQEFRKSQQAQNSHQKVQDQRTEVVLPQDKKTLETADHRTPIQSADFRLLPIERYEHISLLGKGGMGEVWKVRDRYLNRFVAMKIIQSKVQKYTSGLNRFIEEARVNAQLHSTRLNSNA